jgi:hypothetical protein
MSTKKLYSRTIRKKTIQGLVSYDFFGDMVYGKWTCKKFHCVPFILERMPGVTFFPITQINGRTICWPFVEKEKNDFKAVEYSEDK